MKKIVLLLFPFVSAYFVSAQHVSTQYKVNWRQEPFDYKVFVANAGQCNGALQDGSPILYHVQIGEIDAYFTQNGITYRYDEYPKAPSGISREDMEELAEENIANNVKPKTHYLSMNWVGANPAPIIDTLQPQTYYYTYTLGASTNIKAKVYKEIVYRDLYPGIDVDFTFPEGGDKNKVNIKYALIVHPGANISKIKLKYSGANTLRLDAQGNVKIVSNIGTCTDEAPVSYYQEAANNHAGVSNVPTTYVLNGNTESFSVKGKYDHAKTLVVDPTITWDPMFAGAFDNALDVDYDNAGNVFAYGGTFKYQLIKFNNLGVKLWVWNSRMGLVAGIIKTVGNLAVNRDLGVSYVSAGFGDSIWKISPTGAYQGAFKDPSGGGGTGTEDWKLVYNPGQHAIIGGTGGRQQLLMLDTSLAVDAENACGNATYCCHDIVLLALDPSWNFAYMINGNSGANSGVDSLFKIPLPALTPLTWMSHPTFTAFLETNNNKYANPEATEANELNGMAASRNALYVYNGGTIWRASLANGAPAQNISVSPKLYRWGGLSVDNCDRLYAGFGPAINVYNGLTLTPAGTINMATTTDTVYDVKLGLDSNTTLYACGMGFVASIAINTTSCVVVLPIQLLYFNCAPAANGIGLTWATQTETNNKYFTIERSADGVNFSAIATVPGAGNSSVTTSYKYTDMDPQNGTNYYRLSQTDFDGTTRSFNITACQEESDVPIVYPNPSGGEFSVQLPSHDTSALTTLNLYDLLGRKIFSGTMQDQKMITITIPSVSSGIYILSITTPEKTFVNKVLIRK